MSSRSVRRIAFTLLLATITSTSLAPLHARDLGRRSSGGPARVEPTRTFVDFLLWLFDFAKEGGESGGGMDPNG
jgi:hypothetical protein